MSINLGLTSDKKYNCIVGFSGKIIDKENLNLRKKTSTNTLLIHGDSDQIVPANFMLEEDSVTQIPRQNSLLTR